MKYIKTLISTIFVSLFVGSVVYGATILTTNSTDTIGTFRTNTNTNFNVLNSAITDTTSSLGLFASLASTTGNLIVGSSTQWRAMIVGANGTILTASSTAVGGLSWETSGAGITSLNGSTSSTQTFATSGPLLSISTANGIHTFTTLATSSLGLQSVLSFPLSYASTTHISFPIPYASTTGFSYATSGSSGLQIASSSGQWTFSQTQSSNGVSGFLSGTDWTTFNGKQPLISFPIPVASTSLSANTPLSISGNILSISTATAGVSGYLLSTDWSTFNGKSSTTINGLSGAIIGANLFNTTTTLTGGNGIVVTNGGIGATTVYFTGSVSTSTITTATTTKLGFSGDNTFLTSGYKSFGFTTINTTSTASSGIVASKLFYQPFTLANLDCSTNGATVTISAFVRASSTPNANGTTTVVNIACTSTGFSTTTFTNAGFGGVNYLAFASSSVANSTTTLNVSGRYKEQ